MVRKFPSSVTVSVNPYPRVIEINKTIDGQAYLQGIDGKFFNILAQILKFNYNIETPSDREWGRMTNDGNWTGVIGQVFRGEADFALMTAVSEERAKAVDFSEPYDVSGSAFVTTLPEYLPKAYAFLFPFDLITWCCIVVLTLVIPLAFWLLSSTGPSYFERLLYLYGTIMHQSLNDEHFYHKILLIFWWITSIVLSVSYSGAVSSFLSVPLRKMPIRNFHELAIAASEGRYRCLLVKGTAYIPRLLNSRREDLILLANTILKNDWFLTFAESETETSFDGRSAHMGDRTFIYFKFGKAPFTKMYVSEDNAFSYDMALGVRKNFCCKEELNAAIVRIKYAGIYRKLQEDVMYQSWLQYIKTLKIPEANIPLSLQDLSGAMIIFVFGCGLSIIAFIAECCYQRRI